MTSVVVTGATGQLGAPTVTALRAAGHEVRAMSRTAGPGLTTADLLTGRGVPAALRGAEVVVHLATTNGSADISMAQRLTAAVRSAGIGHLVLISIVGIDATPLRFYRDRVRIETVLTASGVPFTLQRATQFHPLVARLFAAQRFLPVLVAPSIRLQPIAVEDVAGRLTELAGLDPQGRVEDIGGPEQRTARDFARIWQRASCGRRPVVPLRLPGRLFAAYDAGANLVPGTPYGRQTFASYLAGRPGP